jgi:hypothetical protein
MLHLTNGLGFRAAFKLIMSDYRRICEYIEPTEANAATYSHRVYELFLRTCTECEAVWKDCLICLNRATPETKLNLRNYRSLEPTLRLDGFGVGCTLWSPKTFWVWPFRNWMTASTALPWYAAYNKVKHSRAAHFAEANLQNLNSSISALFLILWRLNLADFASQSITQDGTTTWLFDSSPFILIAPEDHFIDPWPASTSDKQ